MDSLVALVRRFRELRALVIGDAMLDTYYEGTAARLCSEGPVPVVRKTAEHRAPGGAANTAANLRALGASVAYLATVGHDVAGALLRQELRERRVDDNWLVEDIAGATLHKQRILADGQYVVRFDEGQPCDPAGATEARLIAQLEAAYAQCDVVVVSDYGYGVLSDGVLKRLRELRAAQPRPLVVDSKQLERFAAMQATIITPNHLEARLLVEHGRISETDGDMRVEEIERLAHEVLARIDSEHVAITLAGDGVFLLDRQGTTAHLAAHPVAQANDVGAGDSFTSALALALAAGANATQAAAIGIDAAGIAVTRQWTSVVQHQELLQRVSLRDHDNAPSARIPAGEVGARDALARVMAQLAQERQAGRTIVFTNGVFDLLHAGHIEFLHQAKALGDVLVVGVNSDRSARRLKGPNRPINSERDRLALVAALDPVDYVVLFDDDTPTALIRALRPQIHVKGGDYADEALPEAEAVREVGGRVVILPLIGALSTTQVIERIVALAAGAESEGEL